MSSNDEAIACMEAALKKAKADKIAKAEWRAAEECQIAKARAADIGKKTLVLYLNIYTTMS